MSRWAWALRAGTRRHPWVVRIPINGLPVMPYEVAWFEDALACLHDTGLTEARKGSVIMLLAGYVRNQAATEADIAAAIGASGLEPSEWMAGYVRNQAATEADIAAAIGASGLEPSEWMAGYPQMLRQLADPRRFPALAAFIAAGVFDTADDPDDEFTFGLDRILEGVDALVRAIRTVRDR